VRSLSAEEKALWAKVAATIRPLSRVIEYPKNTPEIIDKIEKVAGRTPVKKLPASPRPADVPRPGTTLDGSWDKRLRNGAAEPDRVLDLHGHSLDRAWAAIDRALEQAIDSGDRLLLLITGHPRAGDPPLERRRIRAAVHDWLAVSRHAPRIAAVRGAHRRHGGGGSLYIVLRRR
jgi:DNA-nicking Smr family endonuclease